MSRREQSDSDLRDLLEDMTAQRDVLRSQLASPEESQRLLRVVERLAKRGPLTLERLPDGRWTASTGHDGPICEADSLAHALDRLDDRMATTFDGTACGLCLLDLADCQAAGRCGFQIIAVIPTSEADENLIDSYLASRAEVTP